MASSIIPDPRNPTSHLGLLTEIRRTVGAFPSGESTDFTILENAVD